MRQKLRCAIGAWALAVTASVSLADISVPGANGSDGALDVSTNMVIDLSLADTVSFADFQSGVNPNPGQGVYIPEQWAVVFRYTSVNVQSGRTVTFRNHDSRAPVVWLVSGSVTIAGNVSLTGGIGHLRGGPAEPSSPGPGGFRGSRGRQGSVLPSAAYGPGGGSLVLNNQAQPGGSHATPGGGTPAPPVYGNAGLKPLIGGSGGGSWGWTSSANSSGGGGAGGGAILIAATSAISITGTLQANGGNSPNESGTDYGSGGSAGGIRLVADLVGGTGQVLALGGNGENNGYDGGSGRIRVEGNTISLVATTPPASQALVGPTAQLWPPASIPSLRVLSVRGTGAPVDPRARLNLPADFQFSDPFPMTVIIEAANMPLNWIVTLRLVPFVGTDTVLSTTFVSGDAALSTWQTQVQFLNGFSVIQARAAAPAP